VRLIASALVSLFACLLVSLFACLLVSLFAMLHFPAKNSTLSSKNDYYWDNNDEISNS
jgi:hypothetical protein